MAERNWQQELFGPSAPAPPPAQRDWGQELFGAPAPPPRDIYQAWGEGRLGEFVKERGRLLVQSPEFRETVGRQVLTVAPKVVTGYLTWGMSIPAQVGAQMGTEALQQVTGITPYNPAEVLNTGSLELAGNMAPRLIFEGFRSVLRRTAGGKQYVRQTALTGAQETAQAEREAVQASAAAQQQALQAA